MKKGDKLFVRIDYRNNDNGIISNFFEEHLDYLEGIAAERYLVGGGFENVEGGMIIFEADNLNEAKEIAENDPIIRKGLYNCKVYEWNLVLLSE